MKLFQIILCIAVFLMQAKGILYCQKNIISNGSLIAYGKVMEVNFEYPIYEELRFNLGDYTIIGNLEEIKIYTDTKTRLLGMRVVTDITKSFSFHVISRSMDTAVVITEEVNRVNSYYPNEVFENSFLNEVTSENFNRFGVWIAISGDSSENWALYAKRGKHGKKRIPPEMLLTNGVEFMELFTVSSDPYFDFSRPIRSLRRMPLMGVEFFENGVSICSIQYSVGAANTFDSGPLQTFGCSAWMYQQVDPKKELVVSAAMSAILLLHNPYLTTMRD